MSSKENKRNRLLLAVKEKGFEVSPDGNLITPDGRPRKITNYNNYPSFNFRFEGSNFHIHMHRLAAYCKYGDVIFEKNILVRHLNNKKDDCRFSNLKIGTPAHNWEDNSQATKEKMLANLKRKRKTK